MKSIIHKYSCQDYKIKDKMDILGSIDGQYEDIINTEAFESYSKLVNTPGEEKLKILSVGLCRFCFMGVNALSL